jgi:hypothetical protein
MKSRKTTVTIEDLLRLKRAEQPPAEFWTDFDRELRAKQLAAIVEPRPWWSPLIRVGSRLSHLQLPIGAAAVLAVTLVSVRQYGGNEPSPAYTPALAAQESTAEQLSQDWSEPSPVYTGYAEAADYQAAPASDYSSMAETDRSSGSEAVAMAPRTAVAVEVAEALSQEPSPSARYIAANLAAAQEADPGLLDDVFGQRFQNAKTLQPIRDPLSRVAAPSESRRSRLLATALPLNATSNDIGVSTNERVSRRLSEERLYDTISRVGVKGDRVAIKF